MGDIVNQLNKLSQKIKLVVLFIVVVVIGVLYVYLWLVPKNKELDNLKRLTDELQRKRIESMTIAANRNKLEEEVSLMNEKLKQALTLLPNETDIRGILRQISILANKIGVDLLFFKPGGVTSRGLFSEIPIELKLYGSFNEIAVYFDRIGKLSRIINIRDINMSGPTQKSNVFKVTVSCMAVTFMSAGAGG